MPQTIEKASSMLGIRLDSNGTSFSPGSTVAGFQYSDGQKRRLQPWVDLMSRARQINRLNVPISSPSQLLSG
ncbi:hypothetical protein HYQ44_002757 [Verticillium longisporum]|nr:hypothetical protein HYQ44_002757 [Verticillium longisporum]